MVIEKIEQVENLDVTDINRLVGYLSSDCLNITKDYLESIVTKSDTSIFLARENGEVLGTFSLVIYKIPTGIKASIEDVVVDLNARGKGVGEAMLRFAIDYASKMGVSKLDLTSKPERVAANNLYRKVGFRKRDTNIYRIEF